MMGVIGSPGASVASLGITLRAFRRVREEEIRIGESCLTPLQKLLWLLLI